MVGGKIQTSFLSVRTQVIFTSNASVRNISSFILMKSIFDYKSMFEIYQTKNTESWCLPWSQSVIELQYFAGQTWPSCLPRKMIWKYFVLCSTKRAKYNHISITQHSSQHFKILFYTTILNCTYNRSGQAF